MKKIKGHFSWKYYWKNTPVLIRKICEPTQAALSAIAGVLIVHSPHSMGWILGCLISGLLIQGIGNFFKE